MKALAICLLLVSCASDPAIQSAEAYEVTDPRWATPEEHAKIDELEMGLLETIESLKGTGLDVSMVTEAFLQAYATIIEDVYPKLIPSGLNHFYRREAYDRIRALKERLEKSIGKPIPGVI